MNHVSILIKTQHYPIHRKDELVQALQQISVEDRKQQLKNSDGELESLESRIKAASDTQKGLERRLQDVQKKRKKAQAELEAHKLKEREVSPVLEIIISKHVKSLDLWCIQFK